MTCSDTQRRIKALREQAAKCREAARVPTAGGRVEDQILLHVAERLERDADQLASMKAGE